MKRLAWNIKQILKMYVQHVFLPLVYGFWRVVYCRKPAELIIFADAHHDSIPVSMELLHKRLKEKGYELTDAFCDYGRLTALETFRAACGFMKLYARARCVFICDNYLPVSSCRKSKRTNVVQLWHSCGAFKRFGYDAADDIPPYYIGNVYRNYDLVTVSSQYCIKPFAGAMHLTEDKVQAVGVSRTDRYFDQEWIQGCRERFYRQYPEAAGKTIILWAPTFRGNAGRPEQLGMDAIERLKQRLGSDYFVICSLHPHIERKVNMHGVQLNRIDNEHMTGNKAEQSCCKHADAGYRLDRTDIPTEEVFPVADVLISDYSSVIFDYMFFGRPYVLYAPDLKTYSEKRGFYQEYESLCPYIAETEETLEECVREALTDSECSWIAPLRDRYLSACDGHATERIIEAAVGQQIMKFHRRRREDRRGI